MHIQARKSNVYPFIGYLHSQVIFPVETGRKSDESLRGSGQWWIWAAPTMTSRRVCCATQQWKTGSSKCYVWTNRGFPQLQDITRRYQEVFSGFSELILNFPIGLSSRVIFSFLPPSRASPRIWSTFGQLYSENGLRENPHETSTLGRKIGAGVKRTVLCWFSLKILKQSMDPQHWVRSREVIMSTPIVIIHIFGYPITGIVSSDILFPSIFQQPNMAM